MKCALNEGILSLKNLIPNPGKVTGILGSGFLPPEILITILSTPLKTPV